MQYARTDLPGTPSCQVVRMVQRYDHSYEVAQATPFEQSVGEMIRVVHNFFTQEFVPRSVVICFLLSSVLIGPYSNPFRELHMGLFSNWQHIPANFHCFDPLLSKIELQSQILSYRYVKLASTFILDHE